MKDVKEIGKIKVITFDGYKAVCFPNSKDTKSAMSVVKELNLDIAILSVPIDEKNIGLGHTLHFVTEKNINVKRLATLLVEEGKKNDLYWKHNGVQTMTSARVHAANLNLISEE